MTGGAPENPHYFIFNQSLIVERAASRRLCRCAVSSWLWRLALKSGEQCASSRLAVLERVTISSLLTSCIIMYLCVVLDFIWLESNARSYQPSRNISVFSNPSFQSSCVQTWLTCAETCAYEERAFKDKRSAHHIRYFHLFLIQTLYVWLTLLTSQTACNDLQTSWHYLLLGWKQVYDVQKTFEYSFRS